MKGYRPLDLPFGVRTEAAWCALCHDWHPFPLECPKPKLPEKPTIIHADKEWSPYS